MAGRVKDLLAQRATESFVGRQAELTTLLRLLVDESPITMHVHGIGGIGKTRLLEEFADQARLRGAVVVTLDCRTLEPSPAGFLRALGLAIGGTLHTPEDAAERFSQLGSRVILALDAFEIYRLMDSWLRNRFLPELRHNVRVLFFGRESAVPAWSVSPGWPGLFRSLHLKELAETEASDLLRMAGVTESQLGRVNRLARGHPLTLKLAAAAVIERPDLDLEHLVHQHVISELTRLYLADIDDPVTLSALNAASVVRRTTLSLLGAMLPNAAPQDAFARLQALPFVTTGAEGLMMHDSVQQAVSASLRSTDLGLYNTLRIAAWHQLRLDFRRASATDLWHYAADLLFLMEQPLVREAFFPRNLQPYTAEQARTADGPTLLEISRRHEGSEATAYLQYWWTQLPDHFYSIRDRNDTIIGYYVMIDPMEIDEKLLENDLLTCQWWQHLQDNPMPEGQRAIFCRRWLDAELGEVPSATQVACWLDIKASYVAMRASLRRIYCPAVNVGTYGPVLSQLRFHLLPECAVVLDGRRYHTAMLDFGPDLFNGWLVSLVGQELGVMAADELLDIEARELVVNGERIALTSLEFELMYYLYQRPGKVVTRDSLITDVWHYQYDNGSNFVDVRIRALRKKLGEYASLIETVPGAGYRFRRL
jgi:hypothetical protein